MKYSIIIPHINEGYLLDIMLDSIYNYCIHDSFEIIIVDDGSDDISHLDFIKTHFLREKINIFFEKWLWSPKARNFWASQASWEYLIFLDSHMYFRDNFLHKLDNILDTNNDIDILQPIIGSITNKKIQGQIYKTKDFMLNSTWGNPVTNKDLLETPNIAWWATIIKRDVFNYVGWFNPNFKKWGAEDLEFSMRLWLSWYNCYFSNQLFVAHYFKESFVNTEIKAEQVLNNKIMFAYTCISNEERLKKIFQDLSTYYWDLFEKIHEEVINNTNFLDWLEKQKRNFIFDDDWYFEKFHEYCETF